MISILQLPILFALAATLNLTHPGTYENKTDREIIEEIIGDLKLSDSPDNLKVYPFLDHIYTKANYQPLWDSKSKETALRLLHDSKIHGLNPEDYRYTELSQRSEELGPKSGRSSYKFMETDVLFTYGVLQFGRHMIEGRTNPEYFYSTWHYQRRHFADATADFLLSCIKGNDLDLYMDHIMPEGGYYDGLLLWMKKYYDGDFGQSSMMNFDKLPLKKGDRGDDVVELKYRLSQYGSYSDNEPSTLFDEELEEALIKFQEYMGIESDGVVGQKTLDALNMTLEEKRDMVRVNMERARWLLHNLPEKLLLVNIAGYELYIFDNLQKVYETPVIVGKIHHETPIFHEDMKFIELNCTWTVPRSISTNEILPSIKKNPNYLSSRHFEVLSNGKVIDPSSINWDQYSASNLPFVFRQKPGPWNSLGTMKFIFPNDYSVYLHDTPARYLFEKEGTRAFSHGCVRVKDPKKLAAFILSDQGVTGDEIDEILATQETQRVYLEESLPVFLTYWTVFPEFPFTDINTMHFVKDIYGRDKKILDALN